MMNWFRSTSICATWVDKDEPFRRQEVSLAEATAYFESKGYHDKVQLLSYRQKGYVTLYQLDDYRDYHQGYMVPSTGYLKWFDLVPAGDGFILHYPQRRSPTSILPLPRVSQAAGSFSPVWTVVGTPGYRFSWGIE